MFRTPIKLCGSADTGRTFVSEGPFLRLEFHSDSKYEEKGFSIEVQHVMNEGMNTIIKMLEIHTRFGKDRSFVVFIANYITTFLSMHIFMHIDLNSKVCFYVWDMYREIVK